MSVGVEEIYRAIGELTARVETLIETQHRSDQEARESRHRVANAAQESAARILTLEHEVRALKVEVEGLKPFAEKAREWEARGKGALAAAGMIGGGIGGALIYFKDKVMELIFVP